MLHRELGMGRKTVRTATSVLRRNRWKKAAGLALSISLSRVVNNFNELCDAPCPVQYGEDCRLWMIPLMQGGGNLDGYPCLSQVGTRIKLRVHGGADASPLRVPFPRFPNLAAVSFESHVAKLVEL